MAKLSHLPSSSLHDLKLLEAAAGAFLLLFLLGRRRCCCALPHYSCSSVERRWNCNSFTSFLPSLDALFCDSSTRSVLLSCCRRWWWWWWLWWWWESGKSVWDSILSLFLSSVVAERSSSNQGAGRKVRVWRNSPSTSFTKRHAGIEGVFYGEI